MENYGKKYKEALRKATKIHRDDNEEIKHYMEVLFPELAESKDEKIREKLIENFKWFCGDYLNTTKWGKDDMLVKDIIIWLEKQGNIDKISYEIAEKEKYDFVSGQFIECRKSFNEFKEGNSYWLEYAGNDNYIGRSDNILNQKFHITPRQLYRLFTQQHFSKENNTNEETNAPTEYDKYVDECLNEASKHFFSEGEDKYSVADLFYAGVRCGKSWLEKQGNKYVNIDIESMVSSYEQRLKSQGAIENTPLLNLPLAAYRHGVDNVLEELNLKKLEKQCEQKPADKEYTFKSIPRLLDMIEPSDRAKAYCQKLIDTLAKEGYNTDVKIVEEVLKGWNGEDVPMAVMDEQKVPVLDFKAKDWYVSKVDGKIHNIYYSVDKPEPKFKVGDWVVNNDTKDVFLIKSFNNGYCTLEDIKGNIISPCLPQCESESHLWTIQDAKDGDVLACNEEILLFKSYSVQGRISLYCWYNGQTNNFHSKEVVDTLMTTRNKICPATKEQRDLLFAKMKEAGYEWDAEKKELKLLITNGGDFFESENCEQKPTEWSLPYGKNETAEKLIALAEILEMDGDCLFNGVSGNSYGKFLRVLAKELTEVKPAEWSKEDDVMVHDILGWLPAKSRPEYNQRRADWLKSLKGRVQPKQKWSEEDERIYKSITYSFAHNYPLTVQQQEFIKSLKDRYTWKPSDEQMEALWCATEKYLESDNANVVELRGKVLESL